ncbi:hypothetical protein N836_01790 [Leptolyngbya sp. Heron Island J]|nr:hypothetical protein N836_01790 [Leptolyngbya sp. Heron Island J]
MKNTPDRLIPFLPNLGKFTRLNQKINPAQNKFHWTLQNQHKIEFAMDFFLDKGLGLLSGIPEILL